MAWAQNLGGGGGEVGGNLRLEADFEFGAGGVVGKGLAKGQAALMGPCPAWAGDGYWKGGRA